MQQFIEPKTLHDQAVEGNVYRVHTAEVNAATGESIKVLFENPSDSGKRMEIFLFRGYVDDGPLGVDLHLNPDTGVPSTTPNEGGAYKVSTTQSEDPKANIYVDTTTTDLSGGVDNGEFAIPSGDFQKSAYELLEPGNDLGLNIPLGALSSGDGWMTAWYIEWPDS